VDSLVDDRARWYGVLFIAVAALLVAALLMGGALAFLFAPCSGAETRRWLRRFGGLVITIAPTLARMWGRGAD